MNKIKAASVQFNHSPGDKASNMEKIRSFVKTAAMEAVDLLVFPEMCITGYWHVHKLSRDEIIGLSESVPSGPTSEELITLSVENNMTIGAGLIERAEDGSLYNTYLVAMPDGRTAQHRKLHCFINEHMNSGNEFTVFDAPQGCRLGILICYDNNIGENVRINALRGVEVLLAPHQTGGCNSPSPHCMGLIDPKLWENREKDPEPVEREFRGPKGREWILRWLPARAHDNGLFLIFSNGVGLDSGEVRTGNSMILDPYGSILAETWKAADEIVIAQLDPGLLEMCTGQRWIKTRRPELYKELSRPTGKEENTRKVRFKTS